MNNQIRAKEVRVIDEKGAQAGVLPLEKALEMAREKELDLIQVTEKLEIPVCRIMDFGKYLYHLKKREKDSKPKGGELKVIRLTFSISEHDMETRAHQTEKFLKLGDKVRIEMRLRGREKALSNFAKEKIDKFIEIVRRIIPVRIENPLKREPRGLTMIISYDKQG
ncbi:MAG: translation initiation factor IF-3 [Candidatus Pacebacteria bacterium]|nr:translation initiation factor IF-3 [Candidatus Paceibacterota bacterium]